MSKLFYVIGPSGAGKDTLMNYARTKINGNQPVIFSHRYITRPPFEGSENHVYLSHSEFEARYQAGFFAMNWESHNQHYGIGTEINNWMQAGFNVVVNGSRQYLPVAQKLYPDMITILIDASADVISSRLAGRGRETKEEIKKRIARTAEITTDLKNCIKVQNDGAIEDAGERLINILSSKQEVSLF